MKISGLRKINVLSHMHSPTLNVGVYVTKELWEWEQIMRLDRRAREVNRMCWEREQEKGTEDTKAERGLPSGKRGESGRMGEKDNPILFENWWNEIIPCKRIINK